MNGLRETPTAASDGLPVPQRYGAMAVILLGIAIAVLDGTIVNLALPGIVRDLHANPAETVWVVTAYQVATLVMLLPFATLGDLIGHRIV
ncbi:MAG: MFS transporter, partial [Rhizobacter sp.]|nr:MFS transporter [Rhizobacter sp.]